MTISNTQPSAPCCALPAAYHPEHITATAAPRFRATPRAARLTACHAQPTVCRRAQRSCWSRVAVAGGAARCELTLSTLEPSTL
jgi:hypothetical protein